MILPGRGHARHNQPGSEEMLYVISGEGEQMVEDDAEHRLGAVRIVAIYAPGGPAAFLRGLPECTVVPAGELPRR